jgi:hypothetical protein
MNGKPNKPRIPAVVRHELENKEQKSNGDPQDDSRLSYRGFEKSKLHSSRKAARKMQREQKKHQKQTHQQSRGSAAEKLKSLEEENRLLKLQLGEKKKKQQPKPQGPAASHKKNIQQRPEQIKQVRNTPEPPKKRLKVLQFSKEYPADRPLPAQRKADLAADDKVKEQERLEALKRGIEEDERLIQELQGKLGQGWKKELEEEVRPLQDEAPKPISRRARRSLACSLLGFSGAGGLL